MVEDCPKPKALPVLLAVGAVEAAPNPVVALGVVDCPKENPEDAGAAAVDPKAFEMVEEGAPKGAVVAGALVDCPKEKLPEAAGAGAPNAPTVDPNPPAVFVDVDGAALVPNPPKENPVDDPAGALAREEVGVVNGAPKLKLITLFARKYTQKCSTEWILCG